jgi:hypothetical protein
VILDLRFTITSVKRSPESRDCPYIGCGIKEIFIYCICHSKPESVFLGTSVVVLLVWSDALACFIPPVEQEHVTIPVKLSSSSIIRGVRVFKY